MISFLARRLLSLAVTLAAASVVVFVVVRLLPGDPAAVMLGVDARDDTLAALRAELGTDRPLLEQYASWAGGFLVGDLGSSYAYHEPVSKLVLERLQVSAPLALMAMLLSTAIAIPLGVIAAANHNRPGDYGVMAFSQIGVAIPNFWFGILLIFVFAVALKWLPSGRFPGWEAGAWDGVKALLMPTVALALPQAGILARVTRSAVLETMGEAYIRTARAKGLSGRAVLLGHALRNAMIPVVTIMGLQLSFLVAGAIIIESVFNLPGVGRLIFQAIGQRDAMLIQSVVLLVAAFVVLVNFVVDLAYLVLDPRIRDVHHGA